MKYELSLRTTALTVDTISGGYYEPRMLERYQFVILIDYATLYKKDRHLTATTMIKIMISRIV